MRNASVWQRVLGLVSTVIEGVEFDDDADGIVVAVRPRKGARRRCGRCGRRAPWYDRGGGRRRWRGLDLGTVRVWLEAEAARVSCPVHGVTVTQVPWARHDTGHTRAFDDTVGWLAVRCSKTAVVELMRIAWRSVGAIVTRVADDAMAGVDRLEGLRRIGIDEISYKKGHRYLTVVVDHESRRLVWAAPGRDQATLNTFFELLGPQRSAAITHVTADAATWIANAVAQHCPNAVVCADPFHVVAWATEALDEARRQAWNDARAMARREPKLSRGRPPKGSPPRPGHERAQALKHARYALWKNPEDLNDHQQAKLAWIAQSDPRLYRAYLLKEGLRHVFKIKGEAGKQALDRWLVWASRCRIPSFVKLAAMIRRHRASIDAALEHNLSNGLIESTNTKIRLLQRIAFGFKSPDALVALAMLALGGFRPELPGRTAA